MLTKSASLKSNSPFLITKSTLVILKLSPPFCVDRGRLKRRGPSDKAYTQEKLSELTTNKRPYPFLYGLLSTMQYRYAHPHPYQGFVHDHQAPHHPYAGPPPGVFGASQHRVSPPHQNRISPPYQQRLSSPFPPSISPSYQRISPSHMPSSVYSHTYVHPPAAFMPPNIDISTMMLPAVTRPNLCATLPPTTLPPIGAKLTHAPLLTPTVTKANQDHMCLQQPDTDIHSKGKNSASDSLDGTNCNVKSDCCNYISQKEEKVKTLSPPVASLDPSALDLSLDIPDISSHHMNMYTQGYYSQQQTLLPSYHCSSAPATT